MRYVARSGYPNRVVDGHARFEILSPTLIRMEYAPDGRFEDRPTLNALYRPAHPSTTYRSMVEGGERIIKTSGLTLRYRLNSGPFTERNLSVELTAGNQPTTAHPAWRLATFCDFATACEAETMQLRGGARLADDQDGYTGNGFVSGLEPAGAEVGWTERGVPAAGRYQVVFRYSSAPDGGPAQTATVRAGDAAVPVTLPPTRGWDDWATAAVPVTVAKDEVPVSIGCANASGCALNIDTVAVTPADAPLPPAPDPAHAAANLGGWRRSLDLADGPRPLFDGLLSRDGWYLLNDSVTAVARSDGGVTPRQSAPGYQDGYFFGYGHDYRQALRDLHDLTGPPVMLPRWALGNWFSRYYAYADHDYRDEILPAFRRNQVPLDVLVVDTDFKAPNGWDGWEWNPRYFPDPAGFLDWARGQGLVVALNLHPSISADDPRYAEVKAALHADLPAVPCGAGSACRVFDFSDPAQLAAYFNLHKPFEEQGPVLWWLDSCCDGSFAHTPGISPDSYINGRYVARTEAQGRRGFSWNRSGSGYTGYGGSQLFPAGPWADHRYTVDTSMDTISSWDMLAFASLYTIERGAIGMPYESHDIGAHNYANEQKVNKLPPDLYARWVQLGAFQPILRLHSNHGYRLPWDYEGAAGDSATAFMRLREALIPYTYTLVRQAYDTGLPMARAMYLNYPDEDAYRFPTQYLFGDDLLVAPVTTPGTRNVPTQVWFPPGTWTDYFTGQSYRGPAVRTVTTDLSTMPVFLRAGGILPTRTDYVDSSAAGPLDQVTLDVATSATGSFRLYEDAGEGLAYRNNELSWTPVDYRSADGGGELTTGAREGGFPGEVVNRTWTVRFRAVDGAPASVTVDEEPVPADAWSYDPDGRTLTVRTAALPTGAAHHIRYTQ